MQIELELLAPAKNRDIGIAAISCGADAVYIAAQSFGAREAAGNSLEEIEELISYAHSFNARIYVTINTILYQEELEQVRTLIHRLYSIGADALIVQDMAIAAMENLPPIPLFASTQCNIRTPECGGFSAPYPCPRALFGADCRGAQSNSCANRGLCAWCALCLLQRSVLSESGDYRQKRQSRRLCAGLQMALHPGGCIGKSIGGEPAAALSEGFGYEQPHRGTCCCGSNLF